MVQLLTILKIVTSCVVFFFIAVELLVTFAFPKSKRPRPQPLNQTELNFQELLTENSKYSAATDICPLRIYGGITSARGDVPYQVALRIRAKRGRVYHTFCGGSIVTKTHVLSAAHCFESVNLRIVRVVAGTTISNIVLEGNKDAQMIELAKIQAIEVWRKPIACHGHAQYDSRKIVNDFAVLEVDAPFEFSKLVKPIRMLTPDIKVKSNAICLVSGYGLMDGKKSAPNLRMVCVPVVPFKQCKRYYKILKSPVTQICAGEVGRDSCQGDSGGPLACNGYLAGIVSYGGRRCATNAGVYTLVSGYTSGKDIPFAACRSIQFSYNVLVITIALAVSYMHNYLYIVIGRGLL